MSRVAQAWASHRLRCTSVLCEFLSKHHAWLEIPATLFSVAYHVSNLPPIDGLDWWFGGSGGVSHLRNQGTNPSHQMRVT